MIIVISGGVGSGKTLTAVRHAVEESKSSQVLTNFTLKKIKNYYRLKKDDVIMEVVDEKKSTDRVTKYEKVVNWEFWEEQQGKGGCDIFLDELHNLISSRQAMKKENILYSEWISQIRKIWGSQGDQNYLTTLSKMNNNVFHKFVDKFISKSNNIYLITQRVRKIDVNFRELCHVYIQCQKQDVRVSGRKYVLIHNNYWFGDDNMSAIEYAEMGVKPKRTFFIGNKYFSYYDSYELISRGGEYL